MADAADQYESQQGDGTASDNPSSAGEAEVAGRQVVRGDDDIESPSSTPLPPEVASGVTIIDDDDGGPWKTTAIVVAIGSLPWMAIGAARFRRR